MQYVEPVMSWCGMDANSNDRQQQRAFNKRHRAHPNVKSLETQENDVNGILKFLKGLPLLPAEHIQQKCENILQSQHGRGDQLCVLDVTAQNGSLVGKISATFHGGKCTIKYVYVEDIQYPQDVIGKALDAELARMEASHDAPNQSVSSSVRRPFHETNVAPNRSSSVSRPFHEMNGSSVTTSIRVTERNDVDGIKSFLHTILPLCLPEGSEREEDDIVGNLIKQIEQSRHASMTENIFQIQAPTRSGCIRVVGLIAVAPREGKWMIKCVYTKHTSGPQDVILAKLNHDLQMSGAQPNLSVADF